MKKLEKLTLRELKNTILPLDCDEANKLKGGGWEYFNGQWTYMLDEVTVTGSAPSCSSTGAWYGNYLGPGSSADPNTLGIAPINQLDSACFNHDVSYYLNDTGGVLGALFNIDVAYADGYLAYESFQAAVNGDNDLQQRIIAGGTSVLFGLICSYKSSIMY